MGRLIPAGTGLEYYRNIRIAGEELEEDVLGDGMSEGIPGYEEDAHVFYAPGSLNEETPEDLGDVE
ncbi:MAG: hypothetical protein LC114_22985 [Bryobacterales bacterium]|nr:hypothetical protein [Bryobacterales bacterium]